MTFQIEKLDQQNQPVGLLTGSLVVGGTILLGGGAGAATGYLVNR